MCGLSTLPVAAYATQVSVNYDDSMKCASLYSYLSDEAEDDAAIDKYIDLSNGWFDAAVARDGTPDGSRAQDDFEQIAERFVATIDGMKSKKAAKAFLASEEQICAGKQALIAGEFSPAN